MIPPAALGHSTSGRILFELALAGPDVSAHGLEGDPKLLGGLGNATAEGQLLQDIDLARRELRLIATTGSLGAATFHFRRCDFHT